MSANMEEIKQQFTAKWMLQNTEHSYLFLQEIAQFKIPPSHFYHGSFDII